MTNESPKSVEEEVAKLREDILLAFDQMVTDGATPEEIKRKFGAKPEVPERDAMSMGD